VQEHGLREINRFVRQPLNPCTQRQMFAFDLLRVDFADSVTCGGHCQLVERLAKRQRGVT
jgi:hypothetical protein